MRAGSIRAIWRYPVKSLRGEELADADVLEVGLPGDRGASLIVHSGHARIGKAYRGKEHDRLHLTGNPTTATRLAAERDVGVRVVDHGEGHDFDAAPISLIFDRWLDGVSEYVGYRVEYQRFRPNLYAISEPGFALDEEALIGRRIAIGELLLEVTASIGRCVAVTYHPAGNPSDPAILRYVAQQRANKMGVYCDVVCAAHISTGMAVLIDP